MRSSVGHGIPVPPQRTHAPPSCPKKHVSDTWIGCRCVGVHFQMGSATVHLRKTGRWVSSLPEDSVLLVSARTIQNTTLVREWLCVTFVLALQLFYTVKNSQSDNPVHEWVQQTGEDCNCLFFQNGIGLPGLPS